MATAVTAIATDEGAVRQFLQSLFRKQAIGTDAAAAAAPNAAAAATGASTGTTAATGVFGLKTAGVATAAPTLPLWLHPRVDAAHPLVGFC